MNHVESNTIVVVDILVPLGRKLSVSGKHHGKWEPGPQRRKNKNYSR
jgi:hypothetical protein